LLVAIQLIPLPPALWTALPGREALAGAATAIGEPQPWRPLSISPGATANALGSLIVPTVTLVLAANLTQEQHWRIATVLLGLVVAGSLLGLLQFTGVRFDHPLTNDIRGMISANFANRNHFALFLAIGCVLALTWAFRGGSATRWKIFVAVGLILLFALMILATGSRAGMLLGMVAIALGLAIVRQRAFRELRRLPRKVAILLGVLTVAFVAGVTWLSIGLNRAASIERVQALDIQDDLRGRIVPVTWGMIQRYFPTGAGFGTFDPAFRISEPDSLLQEIYINHAHNDWLEIVLDAGVAGVVLLAAGVLWFVYRSRLIWKHSEDTTLAKAGSALILLVLFASVVDYPARTPMIMAMLVLAATWLARPVTGQAARQTTHPGP
jgi:O-antigen ligase